MIHQNSSPYYPQSNGLSEAAVKQMKFLLKKVNENFSISLPVSLNLGTLQMFQANHLLISSKHISAGARSGPCN